MFRKVLIYGVTGATVVGTTVSLHRHEYQIDALALVRVSRAASTVLEIGYCYKSQLYSKGLDNTSDEYFELRNKVHKICAEKLLELCKKNKGVYIKVGQHIGALDYLLPMEYVDTMKVLHKDAPQNTIPQLFRVIREDLKQEPNDIFTSFEEQPLGTASLAQVHKAQLQDGTTVAVKVQHYFVKGNTRADIRSMEYLVKIMSWAFPDFDMQWLVNETKANIFRELDFLEEARNSEKIAVMFRDYPWLKIPKVFWEYSTDRVLVMEFVEGGQVNDVTYVKEHKIDPYDLCRKLGDLYSHMIFVNGFVHSDPHPGNILIKKEPQDKEVTVYLLDHGLYANLTDDFRYHYSQFWLSIINRNLPAMKHHAAQMGIDDTMYGALACMVTGRPWTAILEGIGKVKPGATERELVKNQLPDVIDQISTCLQKIDRQALLLLKTNDLLRSVEFTLKTSEEMCGFRVMTKCCLVSVYNQQLKKSDTSFQKMFLRLAKAWTVFKFFLIMTCIDLRAKFHRGTMQRDTIKSKLPEVLDKIALCLQKIDRQAILLLKTNDLIRSIEFSLKTTEAMCGFIVMTKCCLVSVYNEQLKKSTTYFQKLFLNVAIAWTLFKFRVILTCIDLRSKFWSEAQHI